MTGLPMDMTDYRVIVVTGPQRSGTRITAKIIAHETGYEYIDEEAFTAVDLFNWRKLTDERENIVIHCPAMSAYCHELPDDVMVVFMHRYLPDIHRSEQRIEWDGKARALQTYGLPPYKWLDAAAIKYMYWEWQKPQIKNYLEIHYPEDIEMHPLFVRNRDGFDWNQTEAVE